MLTIVVNQTRCPLQCTQCEEIEMQLCKENIYFNPNFKDELENLLTSIPGKNLKLLLRIQPGIILTMKKVSSSI